MPRPASISTEHILDVARREFLARGYGVSTAHIASEAGISEGTIYKRFTTKDALFRASMGLPDMGFVDAWGGLVGTREPEENLRAMGERLLTAYRELLPCLMMLWSSSNADPMEAMKHNPEPPPVKVLLAVQGYVAGEVALGRLQAPDQEAAARMFLGSIMNYVFFETIGQVPRGDGEQGRRYVARVVDTLLGGIGQ